MNPAWQKGVSPEELAALLDGEVADLARAQQLKHAIDADPALAAEFEAQRRIKLALAQLAEAPAPAFMHTRIMGEISARRPVSRRLRRMPAWGAAASAVALFALGFGAATQFNFAPAGGPGAELQAGPAYPTGLFEHTGEMYQTLASDSEVIIAEDADPLLREFLELGSAAHAYRKSMRATQAAASPDMAPAVMVVDSGN